MRSGPDLLSALRKSVRGSELWLVFVAACVGLLAAWATVLQSTLAHSMQQWLFGLDPGERLSAQRHVPLVTLSVLPIGGAALALFTWAVKGRSRPLVDAVEANALHGGRMSARDSLIVSGQTVLSNGFGASVGLEAAFVQVGGAAGSLVGRALQLRRTDLRTLVGAGAGAAMATAFGGPLTGAFYAFEIVLGAYTPTALAPVAAACLVAVQFSSRVGFPSYLISTAPTVALGGGDLAATILLALICALFGIVLMRVVGWTDMFIRHLRVPPAIKPIIGGALLIPLALVTPQALSSGHGALSADLVTGLSLGAVGLLILVKSAASITSLSFGFRGGLFFASLFLGALIGHAYSDAAAWVYGHQVINAEEASLVGMSALAVAVVGGPLTMAMLVLEATHNFGLTTLAIAAALVCNTLVRSLFGYSFSTWRLHLRGETIKSARDVGWMRTLTAGNMMRRDVRTAPASLPLREFRSRFPLGVTSRVVLLDEAGHYAGMVSPVAAHARPQDDESPVSSLAVNVDRSVRTGSSITRVMRTFDAAHTDDLAVVDDAGAVVGVITDAHVRRRYAEELDKSHRELFGEG